MDGPVAVALNCQDLGHLAHDETKGAVVKVPSVFNMGISSCYPPGEAPIWPCCRPRPGSEGEGRGSEGARARGPGGEEGSPRAPGGAGPPMTTGQPPRLVFVVGSAPTRRCHATSAPARRAGGPVVIEVNSAPSAGVSADVVLRREAADGLACLDRGLVEQEGWGEEAESVRGSRRFRRGRATACVLQVRERRRLAPASLVHPGSNPPRRGYEARRAFRSSGCQGTSCPTRPGGGRR